MTQRPNDPATQQTRCDWCLDGGEIYLRYHDEEWGVPVVDDHRQFEFLTLESAQAGLSWLTVLKRRENYRRAFANFDPAKVARFDEKKIEKLLLDPGIIRNRLKVRAAVSNARAFLGVAEEFGSFSDYIWSFVDGTPITNRWKAMTEVPAETAESARLSRDLKKRGFKFVGPTIVYAHMQAAGLVNDHLLSCFRHSEIAELSPAR
ncbi:MAG: DNA-3-methyladenine glycosylase I [Thermoanaerobaculia bacterium]|nr:DNA-3-methyladenine glycosylase I [Thermoanaerobaculia bacterium]